MAGSALSGEGFACWFLPALYNSKNHDQLESECQTILSYKNLNSAMHTHTLTLQHTQGLATGTGEDPGASLELPWEPAEQTARSIGLIEQRERHLPATVKHLDSALFSAQHALFDPAC